MAHVLCLGETMSLITPTEPVALAAAELFRLEVGGAESTVALYLAEAGHHAWWASRVGDDPLGRRMLAYLERHRVDTSHVVVDAAAPTGLYLKDPSPGTTAVHYYRAGSAASRMDVAELDRLPLTEADVVHVSGITPALSPGCAALVEALPERLAGTGALLSFDVNHRPGLWDADTAAPVLLALARRADLVLVGRDEAERLWGTRTAADVRELLPEPRLVVVKDGDVGATELSGGAATATECFVPAPVVDVVEVVGAGDAFAAGYLDALLAGADSPERLTRGHRLAGRALRSTSDFAPLEPPVTPNP